MQTIHEIQNNILKELLKKKSATFTVLKPYEDIEGSHLTFHLKQLLKEDYIVKRNDLYSLTDKGKEFANRLPVIDKKKSSIDSGNTVLLICRMNKKYLIYTRKKHPFYGFQGFPSGKIYPGEFVESAALRNLNEKTGLNGQPELIGINHRVIYSKDKTQPLEDKYIYLFLFDKLKGEECFNNSGDYIWLNHKDFEEYIVKPYHLFYKYFEQINKFKGDLFFDEDKVYVEQF